MQFPDASMIRASLTTVAVAATMHHIKVPRGSTVSKVEVILSDKMSREPWSRDQRLMGCLWKWHRQHISWWSAGISKPKNSKVQRDLVVARPIHFSTFSFAARSNQPLPNLCVPVPFFSLFPRCRSPFFSARSISRQRLPAPFFEASSNTACSFCRAADSTAALFSLRFCLASSNVHRGATGVGLYIRPRTYDSQFSCLFVIRES